jgi:hypothetical protein
MAKSLIQLAQASVVRLANHCEVFAQTLHDFGDWLIGRLPSCSEEDCLREVFHDGKHANERGVEWWGTIHKKEKYEAPTLTRLNNIRIEGSHDGIKWIRLPVGDPFSIYRHIRGTEIEATSDDDFNFGEPALRVRLDLKR